MNMRLGNERGLSVEVGSMSKIEDEIRELFRRVELSSNASGQIRCDLHDFHVGQTGSIQSGRIWKKILNVTNIFDSLNLSDKEMLSTKLLALRDASKKEKLGPIYHCNINVRGREIEIEYFWEGQAFESLSELERDNHGNMPSFIFERIFTVELISFIEPEEIDIAIQTFVSAQSQRNGYIPEELLDMYALVDWQSDTDNGGLNQYFARNLDWSDCYNREEFYPRVFRAIKKIKYQIAEELFEEAMALYAHFYDRVERARVAMNIPSVEKQEESDINDRYFEICDDIVLLREKYVKEHPQQFAVNK